MRVSDRAQHTQKQADAGFDAQTLLIAVAINVLPFDKLKDQVRLPAGRYSCIHQLRDVGMRQPTENAALAFESTFAAFPHLCDMDELHRHFSLKAPIVALGQPNASHAALADLRNQRIRSNSLAGQPPRPGCRSRAILQKTFLSQYAVLIE